MAYRRVMKKKQIIWWAILYCLQFKAFTQKPTHVFLENNLTFDKLPWWTPQLKKTEISPIVREIVGFTTKFSYSPDDTINFKLNIQLKYLKRGEVSPDISIYRLGYYSGHGARLLGKATLLYPLKTQPNCSFDHETRMVDCSNWMVTAQWRIPLDSVSGVYVAVPMFRLSSQYSSHLRKNDNFNKNYIPFVVRQLSTSLGSDILFKVSDLTWVAYNLYGGWNVYRGGGKFSFASRAKKVSYDRPFANRSPEPFGKQQNFLFGTEYPSIYWLEKQGYHVSYASCSDVEELHLYGMLSKDRYRVLLSVGHDEYWTPELREAHLVARDNGIHIAFFSGNEAFWRVIWEENYSGTVKSLAQPPARPIFQLKDGERRIVVCQKETIDGVALSNATDLWTGTFFDPRFRPAEHQHSLTGQHFMVNAMRRDRMTVSRRDGSLRFWRNTTASRDNQIISRTTNRVDKKAAHKKGPKYRNLLVKNEGDDSLRPDDRLDDIAYVSSPGLLGYEWDASIDDCHRPNGMFTLSHTTIYVEKALMETYGAAYKGSGTLTHKLSLYRHVKFRIPCMEDEQLLLSALSSDSICSIQSIDVAKRQSEEQHRSPGALVFGAGTVQWAWALSDFRDGEQMGEDYTIQQATLNLLADMGVFPQPIFFKMNNVHNSTHRLVFPTQSADTEPPKSKITWNAAQSRHFKRVVLTENSTLRIRGTAEDFGGGSIAGVEVSLNGGRTWHAASGRESWTYLHRFRGPPASLADTSDCGTFRSDGDSAVSSYRSLLVQQGQLYDDYLTYTSTSSSEKSSHAMAMTMVIISRAVDDSGWREHIYDGLRALCHLTSPRKLPPNIVTVPIKIK